MKSVRDLMKEIYEENWCKEFSTTQEILDDIKTKAENGCYEAVYEFDSNSLKDKVWGELKAMGFSVERYNGNDDMIDVNWGY